LSGRLRRHTNEPARLEARTKGCWNCILRRGCNRWYPARVAGLPDPRILFALRFWRVGQLDQVFLPMAGTR